MKTQQLLNYARDQWVPGDTASLSEIASAIDGAPVANGHPGTISAALREAFFDVAEKTAA